MHHIAHHTAHCTAHHTAHHPMWQGEDASLEPGSKRSRVTIDADAAAATAAAEREAVAAMKVKDIKEELTRLGGSTLGLLEKG
eukprot:scaffold133436_cov98-Phaeocystis_antarctica.AAC.1